MGILVQYLGYTDFLSLIIKMLARTWKFVSLTGKGSIYCTIYSNLECYNGSQDNNLLETLKPVFETLMEGYR